MGASLIVVAGLMGKYSTMLTPPRLHLNPSSTFDDIDVSMHNHAAMYSIMVLLCVFVAVFALSW